MGNWKKGKNPVGSFIDLDLYNEIQTVLQTKHNASFVSYAGPAQLTESSIPHISVPTFLLSALTSVRNLARQSVWRNSDWSTYTGKGSIYDPTNEPYPYPNKPSNPANWRAWVYRIRDILDDLRYVFVSASFDTSKHIYNKDSRYPYYISYPPVVDGSINQTWDDYSEWTPNIDLSALPTVRRDGFPPDRTIKWSCRAEVWENDGGDYFDVPANISDIGLRAIPIENIIHLGWELEGVGVIQNWKFDLSNSSDAQHMALTNGEYKHYSVGNPDGTGGRRYLCITEINGTTIYMKEYSSYLGNFYFGYSTSSIGAGGVQWKIVVDHHVANLIIPEVNPDYYLAYCAVGKPIITGWNSMGWDTRYFDIGESDLSFVANFELVYYGQDTNLLNTMSHVSTSGYVIANKTENVGLNEVGATEFDDKYYNVPIPPISGTNFLVGYRLRITPTSAAMQKYLTHYIPGRKKPGNLPMFYQNILGGYNNIGMGLILNDIPA